MLAALHPRRVRRLILFAPANPYNRSSDPTVRLFSSPWGEFLAWVLPYLPAPIQRIALGGMYGGANRVVDSSLREFAACLRCPVTLRHVLEVTRSWFAEEAKLKAVLRRVKRTPTLLIWGDSDHTVSLSSGVKLKRKLHASSLVAIPGGGHSVFEQAPEQSNRIMLEWLARPVSSTPYPRNLPRAAFAAQNAPHAASVGDLSPET
jgi:pimeloyl-ACP methyl ester carboxylesterase